MNFFKYKLVSTFLLLIALMGCTKEEVDPNSNFTDVAIFMSPSTQLVQVENIISFADGSRGTIGRKWSIPSPSYFTQINTNESNEQTVHAEFKESGEIPVTLHLEFEDESLNYDSIVYITVLDSITANFAVSDIQGYFQAGENGSWIVKQGTIVSFTDKSSGKPDTYSWSLGSINNNNLSSKTIKVQYRTLGKQNVKLTASRKTPFGRPSSNTKYQHIQVIKNNNPYNLLIQNPSFESGEVTPYTTYYANGEGEAGITTVDAQNGDHALQLVSKGSANCHINFKNDYFFVNQGSVHTLDFWVKVNKAVPGFRIDANIMPFDEWSADYGVSIKDIDTSEEKYGEWQHVSIKIGDVAPVDLEIAKLYLQVISGADGPTDIEIDNVKLLFEGDPTD